MHPAAFQELESLKAQIQLSQQRKTLAFYNKDHNSENVTVAVGKCCCSKLVAIPKRGRLRVTRQEVGRFEVWTMEAKHTSHT